MGIKHIEALPLADIIDVVRNIGDYEITEKVDGVNLTLGRDPKGYLYTSRSGKGGERLHTLRDVARTPAMVPWINAHVALTNHPHIVNSRALKPGFEVEVEVLYGKQPNAIVYGTNRIVFLHQTIGEDTIRSLSEAKRTAWDVYDQFSTDGRIIQEKSIRQYWEYSSVPTVELDFDPIREQLDSLLIHAEEWLADVCVGADGMTNQEVLSLNLTTVPKDEREGMKALREEARRIQSYVAGNIKKLLSKTLHTVQPAFRDSDVADSEDFGIEGVVLRKGPTLIKIVDKERFTAINAFNHHIRNSIMRTSRGTVDESTTKLPSWEACVFTNLLQMIGIPHITDWITVKQQLRKYADQDGYILGNVVKSIAHTCPIEYRSYLVGCYTAAIRELDVRLEQYMSEGSGYWLYIGGGKRVGYTKAVHDRTTLMFASCRRQLEQSLNYLRTASSIEECVSIIFAKQLDQLD